MPTDTHAQIVADLIHRWPEHRVAPSLTRIKALCDLMADPQNTAPVVQITGTNGKGSTAIMIDALLRAVGLRTGRFASPHLVDITERISIDGDPITPERFDQTWDEIRGLVELVDAQRLDGVAMTFFEVMTGMAYAAFADAPVDAMVMEVGMGGTWDATSVADAQVAVLTPVDLDHMAYLGDTVGQIAHEKAGIIKPGAIAVSAVQHPDAGEVIVQRCLDVGAQLLAEGVDFALLDRQPGAGGQLLRIQASEGPIGDLFLPLHGEHMAHNAALAVAAVEALTGHPLTAELIQAGFDQVVAPARLELVRADPPVVIDTAHNPHGVRATLAGAQEAFGFEPLVAVLAMMADKDAQGVLELLEPAVNTLVVTQVSDNPRALPVEDLAEMAVDVFGADRVETAPTSTDAVDVAVRIAGRSGEAAGVLVLGSVYLAGEVRALLRP